MKRKSKKNSDYLGKAVRVRNSYYTFSKDYPTGNIEIKSRRKKSRIRKRKWLNAILLIVCFAVVLAISFFTVDLGLKFSNKEISPSDTTDSVAEQALPFFTSNSLKGIYMPYSKLSDKGYIKDFIKLIKKIDCNSVVIDFKTAEGYLAYSSLAQPAIMGKCAIFDNETIRAAIKQFKSSSINVVARVFCFEDPHIAAIDTKLSVKYLDTDVPWLDKLQEDGGKPWLNPYNSRARNYIKDVITEISRFGVDGIILESVCFPDGENVEAAVFEGEEKGKPRNELLKDFIASLKKSLPVNCFLLLGTSAEDLITVNLNRYSGEIGNNPSDGICADTSKRNPQFVCDKKDGYSSMLSMFSNMKTKTDENSALVLMINAEEYSRKYIRIIKRSGFDNYILYSEYGKY